MSSWHSQITTRRNCSSRVYDASPVLLGHCREIVHVYTQAHMCSHKANKMAEGGEGRFRVTKGCVRVNGKGLLMEFSLADGVF